MRTNEDPLPLLTALKWNSEGLIPTIVQEVESGEVLMMAWMDQSALRKTLEVGQTHFYSRSRRSLWHKGETSRHVQVVESIHVDCYASEGKRDVTDIDHLRGAASLVDTHVNA